MSRLQQALGLVGIVVGVMDIQCLLLVYYRGQQQVCTLVNRIHDSSGDKTGGEIYNGVD